jgi:hypothetical protein
VDFPDRDPSSGKPRKSVNRTHQLGEFRRSPIESPGAAVVSARSATESPICDSLFGTFAALRGNNALPSRSASAGGTQTWWSNVSEGSKAGGPGAGKAVSRDGSDGSKDLRPLYLASPNFRPAQTAEPDGRLTTVSVSSPPVGQRPQPLLTGLPSSEGRDQAGPGHSASADE